LEQSNHLHDSQKNEALNRMVMQFAPKETQYSTTESLHGRVSRVVGIDSLGNVDYYTRLYKRCGILVSTSAAGALIRFLEKKDIKRKQQSLNQELPATRTKRTVEKKRKAVQQRTDNAEAKKRQMDYKACSAVTVSGSETAKAKKKTTRNKTPCPFCGLNGHVTRKSKSCLKHETT
jgi:hypothetical protein